MKILIHFLASLVAVLCFSINLEIPKRYIFIAGAIGSIAWIIYLICTILGGSVVFSSLISATFIAIMSVVFSKKFKSVTSIFFIPGILTLVPGVAMYKMVYSIINNVQSDTVFYLLQAIMIAGGIALSIFITESIRDIQFSKNKEKKNENKI